MKLSTRGRYGLRLMVDLALHYRKGLVLLKDIAARQEISEKYLWHMILPMKTAGFVASVRGARGGYMLSRAPSDITLKDILTTLEGPFSIVDCVQNPLTCNRSGFCVTRDIWKEVGDKIAEILGGITLEDMVKRHKLKQNSLKAEKEKKEKKKKK